MEYNTGAEKNDKLGIPYILNQLPSARKSNLTKGIPTFFLGLTVPIGVGYLLFKLLPNLEHFAKLGYLRLFVATSIPSGVFFIPLPGLAVVFATASILSPPWVALVAGVGSSLGKITGYLLGRFGVTGPTGSRLQVYSRAEHWIQRSGALAVWFFAGFPPFIFDVVAVAVRASVCLYGSSYLPSGQDDCLAPMLRCT
jgi:membrane protein YqaA with SNARE-associated domain